MGAQSLEAVVFDLGGTLLHYQEDRQPTFRPVTLRGLARLRDALAKMGHDLPPGDEFGEGIDRHIGPTYRASVADLRGGTIETPIRAALAEMDIRPDDEQWAVLRARFYSAVDEVVRPRTGARETLSALREMDLKLAIISNTFWAADVHDRHLRQYDLIDLLPLRVYSCDTEHIKPHPAIFLGTLAALGVRPERAAYVGDRLDVDVGGAQAVGMRGVLIASPYIEHDEAHLREIHPDATLQELPDLLDRLAQWR